MDVDVDLDGDGDVDLAAPLRERTVDSRAVGAVTNIARALPASPELAGLARE